MSVIGDMARASVLHAEIKELREALQTLLDCGNAIVGASEFDPEAEEAFAMYDNARLIARMALRKSS